MAGIKAAGPWIAGAAAIAAAFGAFRKTKVVDTGIMGTLGVEGGIHNFTQKRKDGSLFSGPEYTLEDNGVSAFDKPMQDAFKTMRQAAIDMGKILGLTTDHLKDFTTRITLDSADSKSGTRGLNLMGLSEADVQEKIKLALDTANNEMAQQLIGTWVTNPMVKEAQELLARRKKLGLGGGALSDVGNSGEQESDEIKQLRADTADFFKKNNLGTPLLVGRKLKRIAKGNARTYIPSEYALEGEKAIETLTRLASSLGTVNPALKDLNLALYEGSLAGADMAYKLSTLFGGLEGFTAQPATFITISSPKKRSAGSWKQS
jgi:hypothetical protein